MSYELLHGWISVIKMNGFQLLKSRDNLTYLGCPNGYILQFSEIPFQVMLCCTCLVYAVELWFSYSIKLLGLGYMHQLDLLVLLYHVMFLDKKKFLFFW